MTTAHEELQARRQAIMNGMLVTKCKSERNVRYVRSENYWLKITRDSKGWTFAKGYAERLKASEISHNTFRWIPNWNEAIESAKSKIAWGEI